MQEYRLRRQESLQAIENELKEENSQEKQPRKKSKKSSTGNQYISYYFMQIHRYFSRIS